MDQFPLQGLEAGNCEFFRGGVMCPDSGKRKRGQERNGLGEKIDRAD
jgi:hypothetical protein